MYFKELIRRFDLFLDQEWAFVLEYGRYKRDLYSYRWQYFNFFQGWGLFIGTVAFYFNYSLLRFSIYSLSLLFRLLFLPLRVAVELYVSSRFLRQPLLFFCAFFETVGGILGIRQQFLDFAVRALDRWEDKWEARKEAFIRKWDDEDNNPLMKAIDKLVRANDWFDRTELRIRRGLGWTLYRYGIRKRLPAAYRTIRRGFRLRFGYLRFRARRFRKGRLRRKYLYYLGNGFCTHFWATKLGFALTTTSLYLRGGSRVILLGLRFLGKVLAAPFSSTALVGRSLRYPREGRQERYRISRHYPRKISRSSFGHKKEEAKAEEPKAPEPPQDKSS